MNKLCKRFISIVTLGIMSMSILTGCSITIAKPAVRKCSVTINSIGNGIDISGNELEERNYTSEEIVSDGDYFREDLEGHLLLNNSTDNYPIVLEIIHVGEETVRFKEGDVTSEISFNKFTTLGSSIGTEDWYNYIYKISFENNVTN